MISSDTIALQFLQSVGEDNLGSYLDMLRTWISEAVKDIGFPVEVYLKTATATIDPITKSWPFPPDYYYLDAVKLVCGTELVEPSHIVSGAKEVWGATGAQDRSSTSYRISSDLAIGDDPEKRIFYIITGWEPGFSVAHMQYVGNDVSKGEFFVHNQVEIACKRYLAWMWTNRLRQQDRNAIPQSEVDTKEGGYIPAKLQAYSRMKTLPLTRIDAASMQRYYKPLGIRHKRVSK